MMSTIINSEKREMFTEVIIFGSASSDAISGAAAI